MVRDLARLASTEFDVLIVGAGIYGVAIAWDAALRGLEVAIIDRGDFGAATSFNSAKTVHGGVRALQRGAISEVRQYVRERRALSRIAPHLVHPLAFVLPTSRGVRGNRLLLRTYFAAHDLLAWDRNRGLEPSRHLPPSRLLSREETLRLNPLVEPDEVTGGIEWHDCQMYSTDRVALSFLFSAAERGAVAANYVELVDWRRTGTRITGIVARDRVEDQGPFDVRARVVVNATGPWARRVVHPLLSDSRNPLAARLSKAMNLVTAPLTRGHAVSSTAGSRLLFVAPWRHCSIVGTSHDSRPAGPDDMDVRRSEVEAFLHEVRRAFPRARLDWGDIRLVHRGLLPAVSSGGAHSGSVPAAAALLRRSQVHDHRRDGLAGLVSVAGVRYTTARHTAARVVDLVCAQLGRPAPPCRTAEVPLVGGECADVGALLAAARRAAPDGLVETDVERLAFSYGTRHDRLYAAMRADPGLVRPLGRDCRVTRAEISHAVHEENALRLSDAVLRRTEAGSAGHPGADALAEAARVMAALLGWDARRIQREIEEVERVYRIEDD